MIDSKFCVYKLMLSLNVIHCPHANNVSVLFSPACSVANDE